jgi:LysM repeat protein
MQSRRWGLIAVVALVMAAALLAITLIWRRGPETSISVTLTTTSETAPTASPSRAATPTPAKPVTYTVQAGDTLSAIAQEHDVSLEALTAANDLANPDVLQIGQVLIIPEVDSTASPSLALTETSTLGPSADEERQATAAMAVDLATMTPSGPPLVEIEEATGIGNLETETITLINRGGEANLEAWTLSSSADDQFIFPALTLFPEGKVRVHSMAGDDTPRDLYWGRTASAWQDGELVTLRDADGNVVDTYIVPE